MIPVRPDHFNEWNDIKQVNLGLFDPKPAEIFNSFLAIRYRHKSPVRLIMASDPVPSILVCTGGTNLLSQNIEHRFRRVISQDFPELRAIVVNETDPFDH